MTMETRRAYFDHVASSWDSGMDLQTTCTKLGYGLEELDVGPDETVIDLGCGTGNLTVALLNRLSPRGRVLAVDFSSRMISLAREKVRDARAHWVEAEAKSLPFRNDVADRVIGYCVWPHLQEPEAVAMEIRRVLKPAGLLHLWHNVSRTGINTIHARAGGTIGADVLMPARELVELFESRGFESVGYVDDESRYRITVRKPAN